MSLLLDLATGAYHLGIRLAAPFHAKAKQWVNGRAGLWDRLEARAPQLRGCIWMHCASVGEFEQGRPVLEALLAQHPGSPLLLTFFSPSGYEARKDFAPATHVDHLPPDGRANAERFVRLVQPSMALFVKYEFWPNHLHALKAAAVPTYLVSAIFRADQPFFRWYGGAWRRMLRCFTHIFTQDVPSCQRMNAIGMTHATVSGDTRFDRVARIVEANEELPVARSFREGAPTPLLICGSTWPADERVLLDALHDPVPALRTVITPHEPAPEHLRSIEERFPKPLITWSEAVRDPSGAWAYGHMRTCLVDTMGVLARLYKYGDIAYVGGGFGDGIHSLLEAAAWGRPVIFGPRHTKFAEAQGLIEAGGGFEVRDGAQLASVLQRLLGDPGLLASASEAAARYVQERRGATDRVVAHLIASGSAPR